MILSSVIESLCTFSRKTPISFLQTPGRDVDTVDGRVDVLIRWAREVPATADSHF